MKLSSMEILSKKYKIFLFDQWGVLHDGNKIFKFTNATIEKIKNRNLILISNTSQTVSEFKLQTLKKLKLNYTHFNKIITAGQALINLFFLFKSSLISKIYTFVKGVRFYQIGYIAKRYSDIGGKVYYIGKPYKDIFHNLVKMKEKKKTIIIGDNLDTDILGGNRYKIKTALALNGFKKLNRIKSDKLALKEILKKKIQPDYIIQDISIS